MIPKRALVLLAALTVTPTAFGTTVFQFTSGSAGTAGSYFGSSLPASGSNIPIGSLLVTGTPSMDGTYDVQGTCLSIFAAGCFRFNTGLDLLTITGSVPALGVSSQTLLSSTFNLFVVSPVFLNVGSGTVTLAPALLSALGVPSDLVFSLAGTVQATNGTVLNSNFLLTEVTFVPEPAATSLLSFGLGALLLTQVLSRKRGGRG